MERTRSVEIDEKTVNLLLRKIILLEKTNLKTNEYGYVRIVKKIMQLIEEEVECY